MTIQMVKFNKCYFNSKQNIRKENNQIEEMCFLKFDYMVKL